MITRISVAAFVFMMCISTAAAEERFGVVVYPGAKYDQIRTNLLARNPSIQGAAYRTNDSIEKVIAFYNKQGLLFLKVGSPSKERARFKKMDIDVDVVVQNPWKDAQTGATMTDTLILIIKEEEKKGE
ncbi:MAG: hypothetical protein WA946_09040 [Nitrospirota bacterium]